mgnify:CR=1 FL=1
MNKNLVKVAYGVFYASAVLIAAITVGLFMDYKADPNELSVSLMVPLVINIITIFASNYIIDRDKKIKNKRK